jgi:ABC-2 type transport system permease protein
MTAVLALLRRDLHVSARTAGFWLAGSLTQPILIALVFANIFPRLGLVADSFPTILLPGLMSITILLAGVQGVLAPLSADLAGTREIDERLLAPVSVFRVAFEKIVAGAMSASMAGLVALPALMILMYGVVEVHPRWPLLVLMIVVNGYLSAAFGLVLGSIAQVRFTGILFALVIGPMMLFGCAYYPWSSLAVLGWVQYLFLVNPLVFMCEALRFAATPDAPHMPLPLLATGLAVFAAALTAAGARAFERRTIL